MPSIEPIARYHLEHVLLPRFPQVRGSTTGGSAVCPCHDNQHKRSLSSPSWTVSPMTGEVIATGSAMLRLAAAGSRDG
ncbi:MAG: hypothetical protein L0Z62_29230 [Gemmataceae bacterium]|nr:hypothetical protein [Gemmataceae bacterium]